MKSMWKDSVEWTSLNQLNGNLNTDVLIIGGGMSGVLCAYYLDQMGVDYALVEGKTVGSGITKNTTAKLTSQHGLIYNRLIKSVGKDKAKMYLDINELGLGKYKELCKTIDCDFEEKSAFTYSLKNRQIIEDEVKSVKELGFNASFVQEIPLPFKIKGAIEFKNQGQFNPLKFLFKIAKNLNIYENTFVNKVTNSTAITNRGNITAKKIIIATHFPFINAHGSYFLKMFQHRSYVIALENPRDVHGMYVDEVQNGMSFRNYKELLLVGGGDHRTGKQGGGWSELREFVEKYYPNSVEKYAWATEDCMTLDEIPYIGHYSKSTPNIYVATGFNKWGMTSSMVSAMILSNMVVGKTSDFAEVFSPHRSMLKPQILVNGFEAVTNLLTFSTKRCTHLGCALKWNSHEHTWDCPCHGSRFEVDGKLIDNPAMSHAKVR